MMLIMMVWMLMSLMAAMEMSLVVILVFKLFFTWSRPILQLITNNSFSGGEIYCSTCYTREFGPGGRSKFGEKTEVQDNYNSHINNFNHFLACFTIFQVQAVGGDKGACLR